MHVGLVGARGFGQHHLAALQRSPHVTAVSLAGRDRAALEALKARYSKVRRVSAGWESLVDDPAVELLDIALPHDLHLPVALAALARGKHVLVEKPPALTPAGFQEMIAAAEAAGRRLFTIANLLFSPVHHVVRALVDRGDLGEPFLSLEVRAGGALSIYRDPENWRADRERCGGGLLIDGGYHSIYRQLYFLERLGAPHYLTADCDQIGVEAATKGEDFAALTLAYPGGARVHLVSAWTAPAPLGRFPSGIVGTEATLVFQDAPEAPLALRRPGRDDLPVPVPEGPRGFAETVRACVAHYVECLATGAEPYVGHDLPLLTLEIIAGAYAAQGGRVELHGRFATRFPPLAVPETG